MTDINKQLQGRRNKACGERFEKMISDACEYYYKLNIAFIEKTPEPMRVLRPYKDRKNGQYIACFTKSAQPDYKGILCDGTSIMFEAKYTESDRIRQSVITKTQWGNLDAHEKYGACCYVLVSFGLVKFYRVPWSVWKKMKELFHHKYMSESELEIYKIPFLQYHLLILEGVVLKND